MDRRELIVAYGKANRLTPELAYFIRSRTEKEILDRIKSDKPNKEIRIAAGIPTLKKPSKKIATEKEINDNLELHSSAMGMEYTGFEEVSKEEAMIAKLDREWEVELNNLPIDTQLFTLGVPARVVKICNAATIDSRYKPLASLFNKNVWVYGPDRDTFVWYIYFSINEKLDYASWD